MKQKDLLTMRGLNSTYPKFEIEAIEIIRLQKLFGTSENINIQSQTNCLFALLSKTKF